MNENDNIKELISKSIAGSDNCLSIRERGELAKDKIAALVKAKGYKSVASKKASEFFLNKSFAYELKNGNIFAYKLDSIAKGTRGIDVYASNCLLYSVKTKGGTIYVTKKNNGTYICWTAHFFDRLSERSGLKLNRKDTIKYYFKNYLLNGNILDDAKVESGLFRSFSNDGADLGELYLLNGEKFNGTSETLFLQPLLIFFKTFVSKNMFTKEQNKTMEKNIQEVIASLEESDQDVFNQEKKFIKNLQKNEK